MLPEAGTGHFGIQVLVIGTHFPDKFALLSNHGEKFYVTNGNRARDLPSARQVGVYGSWLKVLNANLSHNLNEKPYVPVTISETVVLSDVRIECPREISTCYIAQHDTCVGGNNLRMRSWDEKHCASYQGRGRGGVMGGSFPHPRKKPLYFELEPLFNLQYFHFPKTIIAYFHYPICLLDFALDFPQVLAAIKFTFLLNCS